MHEKSGFKQIYIGKIFLGMLPILFLILAQLGLAFAGVQPVSARMPNAVTSTPNTMTWTDPGGSGLTISFTTVHTYDSCISIGDRIYTTGIPADWTLNGYVNLIVVQSDSTWLSYRYELINQLGDMDLTLDYPPAWTWPFISLVNVREIHVDLGIKVLDQNGDTVNWVGGDPNLPGILGPSQDWDVFCSNPPPGPKLTITKYTNGSDANDPDGIDVPNIVVGDTVTWTYHVTNTGTWSIASAYIVVSDDQLGVTPVFEQVITGNIDDLLDPGEVWEYKATGAAVNLTLPPPGVIVQPGVCTRGGTENPRTAYINTGTVTIPGLTVSDKSSYCNPPTPDISIIKYTNGFEANDPDGADVPQIKPGDPVTWTYKVTNTGETSVLQADVVVTDDQTGVTPAFESELSGDGDLVFEPGEVWQYTATGVAVDLSIPQPIVTTVEGVCTLNKTQPPHTAYVNQGTASIPGASDTAKSSYCNPLIPGISIVKYTNGNLANDPNGTDVPQINPGDPVTWTYHVTNTGEVPVAKVDVVVTDNQPGVSPTYNMEIFGNGDEILDPGEVWQYIATGNAVDNSLHPQGVTIVDEACTYTNTVPPSPAYVNTGTVTIPGDTDSAISSYCNPLTYPPENGYLGIEDWIKGDYDYNDFGFYFRIEETIAWLCPGGVCGPHLSHVKITTTSKVYDSGMDHLIHLHRVFTGGVHYTVTRSAPAYPNTLVLFDGTFGAETPDGNYISATGDIDVTLYNTAKYTWPQKLINETVVIEFSIDNPELNPRDMGTFVRSYTVGSTTFYDLDPIMSNYDFWEEGTIFASRWHLKDTHTVDDNSMEKFTPASRLLPVTTVVPFMIVVPFTDWIPPFERTTITGPYASFRDFYMTGVPDDWYLPSRVTMNCVIPSGISWGPYPGGGACNTLRIPMVIK